MFKMNKKGGEKLLSVWWFFVLAIIGVGIISGVLLYYSAEININQLEAEVLAGKLAECLNDNGYLNNHVFNQDFDIFDECNLEKNVFEKNTNFYFNVSIYLNSILISLVKGDSSFEKDCRIQKKTLAKHFPRCFEIKERLLNSDEEILEIIILAGSNQEGGKVI